MISGKRFILVAAIYGMHLTFVGQPVTARDFSPDTLILTIPDSSHVQILRLRDGSEIVGRVIEIGESDIVFQSGLGASRLAKSDIEEIVEIPEESVRPGGYWFPNPNVTRLFFAPTGRMLKKGQGYFSTYFLFFPSITGAFSDRVTVGAGMSLLPGLGVERQAFYVTPQIGLYQSDKHNLSVGALVASVPAWDIDGNDIPTFGATYIVGSIGRPDASLTGGLTFGFADGEFEDRPAVLFGGQGRLSRRISFVSENWKFPGIDFLIISYGFRFFGEKISVDLGFFNGLGSEDNMIFPGLPWVDFVYNF
jgi:hypothetical protein